MTELVNFSILRTSMNLPTDKRFKNLTGIRYGRLIVVSYHGPRTPESKNKDHQWNCKCDCGSQIIVSGKRLKSGETQSCGCYHRHRIRETQRINLVNKIFGKLQVVESSGDEWRCKCQCGKEVTITGHSLRSGVQSCGCLHKEIMQNRFIDLVGQRFNKLLVLKYSHTKHGHTFWYCKCDCGNQKIISGSNMRKGLSKSCGCLQKTARLTHGLSGTPEYKKMRRRNPIERLKHNIGCLMRHAIKKKRSKLNIVQHLIIFHTQLMI